MHDGATEGERATAVAAIGMLGGTPDPALLDDDRPRVRLPTALVLAHTLGTQAPEAADRELRSRVADGISPEPGPFLHYRVHFLAVQVLQRFVAEPGLRLPRVGR